MVTVPRVSSLAQDVRQAYFNMVGGGYADLWSRGPPRRCRHGPATGFNVVHGAGWPGCPRRSARRTAGLLAQWELDTLPYGPPPGTSSTR